MNKKENLVKIQINKENPFLNLHDGPSPNKKDFNSYVSSE
jgi:hypothetical protein